MLHSIVSKEKNVQLNFRIVISHKIDASQIKVAVFKGTNGERITAEATTVVWEYNGYELLLTLVNPKIEGSSEKKKEDVFTKAVFDHFELPKSQDVPEGFRYNIIEWRVTLPSAKD